MKSNHKILILLAFFCLTSCVTTQVGPEHDSIEPEERLFLKAERKFQEKIYPKALQLYNEYLTLYPDGASASVALMREGEIYKFQQDYSTARKVYQYLIDKYENSRLVPDAMVAILETLYNENAYREVIRRANSFIIRAQSGPHIARIHVMTADAYAAIQSLTDAVYYYAKASEEPEYPGREYTLAKFKNVLKQISVSEIMSLLERVRSEEARGYLMFHLGLKNVAEEKYDDALTILNQFKDMYPTHEYFQQAVALINEIEELYEKTGYGQHIIGCLLPLSGSHKLYGKKALRGIELALKKNNAQESVQLIVKDSGSDPVKAVAAVKELADANVSVIIGPIITAEAAASTAQEYGIPMIALTHKPKIAEAGSYIFRNFITPKMQAKILADYAVTNLNINQFAILYPDEKYGVTFMNLFWNEVKALGGNVNVVEPYDTSQKDFSRLIRKLARQRSDFDAVFIPDGPNKIGLIVPQMRYHNVSNVQLLGTNLWHSPKLLKMARKSVKGAVFPEVFFAESRSEKVMDFVAAFKENFDEKPGFIEALSYDTSLIILDIFHNPSVRNRTLIKEALIQVKNFEGVTGSTSFDVSGEPHKSLYILKIDKNGFVELN